MKMIFHKNCRIGLCLKASAVSRVLDDSAIVAADFRIDETGHQRVAIFADKDTGERRLGRIIQRLCEIETYKSLSMQGFATAREIQGRMGQIDAEITDLMKSLAEATQPAETTLAAVLRHSAELKAWTRRWRFALGRHGPIRRLWTNASPYYEKSVSKGVRRFMNS